MNVVDSIWYSTSMAVIGIVVVSTDHGHQAYIGTCSGRDQQADEHTIAMHGAKFYHCKDLFPHIHGWSE